LPHPQLHTAYKSSFGASVAFCHTFQAIPSPSTKFVSGLFTFIYLFLVYWAHALHYQVLGRYK
jgi:hypothetical protein